MLITMPLIPRSCLGPPASSRDRSDHLCSVGQWRTRRAETVGAVPSSRLTTRQCLAGSLCAGAQLVSGGPCRVDGISCAGWLAQLDDRTSTSVQDIQLPDCRRQGAHWLNLPTTPVLRLNVSVSVRSGHGHQSTSQCCHSTGVQAARKEK